MKHLTVICAFIAGIIAPAEALRCGKRPPVSRIVGGKVAAKNSWPWQAMLTDNDGRPFCGGAMIHPQYILTAAHCVHSTISRPSLVKVRMGAHYRLKDLSVGTEQDFDVIKIDVHPDFNFTTDRHDIALLKLDRPALIKKGVDLVCLPDLRYSLPRGDEESKIKCFITGWGKRYDWGHRANELMEASVPLVSEERCMEAYGPEKIHKSMLCAGLEKGVVDSCHGDSGGPLVCEWMGLYYLEGIVSWGDWECAAPKKYGVYAKIRWDVPWLLGKFGKNWPNQYEEQ